MIQFQTTCHCLDVTDIRMNSESSDLKAESRYYPVIHAAVVIYALHVAHLMKFFH